MSKDYCPEDQNSFFSDTLLSGRQFGTLPMTIIYVIFGCSIQFLIGTGLAYICTLPIQGRPFFRTLFFIPITITPVGIAYQWRMLADMSKGPFAPVWEWLGLAEFAWGSDAWAARTMIMISDAWMWIPFIFVVMLAGLETVPKDLTEAAEVDGAGKWPLFWKIIFPIMLPVSLTTIVIRIIFKLKLADIIINVTSGGPGGATDSVTSFIYREYRDRSNVGYGTLLSFVYLIFIIIFMTILIRFVNRWLQRDA